MLLRMGDGNFIVNFRGRRSWRSDQQEKENRDRDES
jgi:hypothetical protein